MGSLVLLRSGLSPPILCRLVLALTAYRRLAAERVWCPNRLILAEYRDTNRCELCRLSPQQQTFEKLKSGVGGIVGLPGGVLNSPPVA